MICSDAVFLLYSNHAVCHYLCRCDLGVRINLGYLLDVTESQALSYKDSYIQIYSNSWGPPDNGFLVQGPGYYSGRTLKQGVATVSMCVGRMYTGPANIPRMLTH